MNDCIFCMIINNKIPSKKVYENEKVLAFEDIAPQAPIHVIIIPKVHVLESIEDITKENVSIISEIMLAAKKVAKIKGVSQNGYRLINNCGKGAGQTVNHLHFHFIAGKDLGEKIV